MLLSSYTGPVGGFAESSGPFDVQLYPIFAAPGQQVTQQFLAMFSDSDPNVTSAGDITASVSLGANNSVTTSVIGGGDGQYAVDVTFTPTDGTNYANDPVDYCLSLSADGQSYTSSSLPLYITGPDGPGTVDGSSLAAAPGTALSGVIASFGDANSAPGGPTFNYSAQIVWGDGSVTWDASVNAGANLPGLVLVSDSHTYADAGTYSPQITVCGDGNTWVGTMTATVGSDDSSDQNGGTQIGGFSESSGPFNVQLLPIFALPDVQITAPIAIFSLTDPTINPDDLTAGVSFGCPAPATINPIGDGQYEVDLTCCPWVGAPYVGDPIDYWLYIQGDGQTYTSSSLPIYVTTDGQHAQMFGAAVNATADESFSANLGEFTDPNNPTGDSSVWYGTQVVWGDGAVTWSASVTGTPNTPGDFLVGESHTYSAAGTYNPQITVFGDNGAWTGTATVNVVVVPPFPATLSPTVPIAATDQQAFSGTVARFTTTDPNATAGDFTATINYNDGTNPDTATVSADPNGGFDIIDTHTFPAGGVYYPTIELDSNSGESASGGFIATVTDPGIAQPAADAIAVANGTTDTYTVASFYDSNYQYGATVSASVNWMDGSDPVSGTVNTDGNGSFWITATYTATATQTISPEVTITDSLGAAYVADPALVANIDTSGGAVDGQPFTLPLWLGGIDSQSSAGLDSSQIPAYWYITWGDGADGYYPISDTSETHPYALGTTSQTITAEVTDASQQNVLATAYADPLVFTPAAPINLAAYWTYSVGNTPRLTLCWTNDSSLATGFEIDELSGDGQTYTTVDTLATCSAGDSMSDTISVPNPDPEAMYYIYATDNDGTSYSDTAAIQAGIIQPTLARTAVTYNSVTLAYSDPSNAQMTLYYEIPGVDNMHCYADLGTSGGTITVTGLTANTTYDFQIDAYTADQDTNSGSPLAALTDGYPVAQPTIVNVALDTVDLDGNTLYYVTYQSTDPNSGDATLDVWLPHDDDPLRAFPGPGNCLWVLSQTQSGGVYTYVGAYRIVTNLPAGDDSLELQISVPGAPLSPEYAFIAGAMNNAPQAAPTVTLIRPDPLNPTTRTDITVVADDANTQSVLVYAAAQGKVTCLGSTGATGGVVNVYDGSIPSCADIFAVGWTDWDAHPEVSAYVSGPCSNFVPYNGGASLPQAPSNLTVAQVDQNDAFLHWTDNSDNENTFEVDVLNPADANNPNDPNSWIPVATGIPSDSTTYTVTQDEITAVLGSGAILYGQTFQVEGVDAKGVAAAPAKAPPKHVDIYIFVLGNQLPRQFNAAAASAKINQMLAPQLAPSLPAGVTITVHITVVATRPKSLGWQKGTDQWFGFVWTDATSPWYGITKAGSPETRINLQEAVDGSAQLPQVNFDQYFANILAHEQLNNAIDGQYDDSSAPGGDIRSNKADALLPATFPNTWGNEFIKACRTACEF